MQPLLGLLSYCKIFSKRHFIIHTVPYLSLVVIMLHEISCIELWIYKYTIYIALNYHMNLKAYYTESCLE